MAPWQWGLGFAQVVETSSGSQHCFSDDGWFAVAEQALNTIYVLHSHVIARMRAHVRSCVCTRVWQPHELIEPMVVRMSTALFGDEDDKQLCDERQLARFVFVVGHIGVKQLVHIERAAAELGKRTAAKEASKEGADSLEAQLGLNEAAAECDAEEIRMQAEHEIMEPTNLLGTEEALFFLSMTMYGTKALIVWLFSCGAIGVGL